MKSPRQIFDIESEASVGAEEWILKHFTTKNYVAALNVLSTHQWSLYYLSLMHLRWGFDGLKRTLQRLDDLLPQFETAYAGLKEKWESGRCRLDAHMYLAFLVGHDPIDPRLVENWIAAGDLNGNWECEHKWN